MYRYELSLSAYDLHDFYIICVYVPMYKQVQRMHTRKYDYINI